MRILSSIIQPKALEWGLNLPEAVIFDYLHEAPAWAEPIVISGQVWYWVSRTKVAQDIPIISAKVWEKMQAGEKLTSTDADTYYRHFKSLEKKGLIVLRKFGEKDCFSLTEKAKGWNKQNVTNIPASDHSEIFPKNNHKDPLNIYSIYVGNISEHSEIFPSELPESEKRIREAVRRCKVWFSNYPDMEKVLLDRAKLKADEVDFSQEIEGWISNNSHNLIFMQDPENQISRSFTSWLMNRKRWQKPDKQKEQTPQVYRPRGKKSVRTGGITKIREN